ncbi:MAG: hypothetical protein ACYS3S_18015 [Planctomycetota bacterium]|jgi:photosystem II stability/assembly factor-like uncharacterized protein
MCLAQDPFNSNIVYAGGNYYNETTGNLLMSVCKSTNGGISWPIRRFLGSEEDYGTICNTIAVAPSDSAVVYAGGQVGRHPKVFRSTDAGDTWSDITDNLSTMYSYFNDSVRAIWVSPYNHETLLVGTGKSVFKRTVIDRGRSSTWIPTTIENSTVAFAYDQAEGTVYAATSQGVYRTNDAGSTWQELNDGLDYLDVLCIAFDSNNGMLYAGTNGGSVWRLSINPTDLNDDGIVNLNDYTTFANKWLDACFAPDWCRGSDLNRDGKVYFEDLLEFTNHWLR